MYNENVSYVLGMISLVLYSIVYFPQLRLLYKTKKSDDLSILMFILWSQADVLSLIGLVVLQLELTLIIIGWYHLLVGIGMMGVIYYYRSKRTIIEGIYILSFVFINISVTIVLHALLLQPDYEIGEVIGWITAVVYVLGRVPQIYLNCTKRSTENLSVGMYIYTILGSIFYVGSIYAFSLDPVYLRANLPWIAVTFVTIVIDIFIVAQCYYYRAQARVRATVVDMVDIETVVV